MELDLSKQAKVQMGIATVIGLVVGVSVGAFVGSTVLAGNTGVGLSCSDKACIEVDNDGAFNVKIEANGVTTWGKVMGGQDGIWDTVNQFGKKYPSKVKIKVDAPGVCGGTFKTVDGLTKDDYPLKINVEGSVCTPSAEVVTSIY
ncbi:MAG: hypothetical protein SV760_08590 [Halobacteria archaeon]|nr:hypothetical protein [Halobacteria archaeon]